MPTFSNDFMKSTPHSIALQLDSSIRSDPVCGSGGCIKWKHDLLGEKPYPMNYKVADFGMDHDIKTSLKHSEALTLPAETKDADGEDVFPYQDEKFNVESHYKFVPIQNT